MHPKDFDFMAFLHDLRNADVLRFIDGDGHELPFTDPNEHDASYNPMQDDDFEDEYEEECFAFGIPDINSVIYSGPATTILWSDGSKTTVRLSDGQQYDRYAGFCAAIVKKLFGSTSRAKAVMDLCDAELTRQRKEAEKESRRKACDGQRAAGKDKPGLSLPPYTEFADMVNRRVIDKVVDRLADSTYSDILAQVAAKMAAEKGD